MLCDEGQSSLGEASPNFVSSLPSEHDESAMRAAYVRMSPCPRVPLGCDNSDGVYGACESS